MDDWIYILAGLLGLGTFAVLADYFDWLERD